jgi:predicted ATPase
MMKIDIHTHTKKCKSGDAPTREISPENFCEVILSTEVRIIAITNHNVFDLDQYTTIDTSLGEEAQVWPGIELDILEEGSRGHLLVIVSPTQAKDFSEAVDEFTKGSSLDNFTATIDEVLVEFDSFKPVYVAHYKQKKPNLSDDALEKLLAGTKNPGCVIKEVTNSISAGIYISHGHASIYGSDVHDWAKYEELSHELPDLRLPVDSFEHFCLLLEKDPTTINTVLDRKTSEDLVLLPFDDGSILKFRAFNDINVVFGAKGTGKTCILRAIAKHYTENGIDARVYESASDRLDEIFDTKGRDLTINLNNHGINYCTNEIKDLRAAGEVGVTNLDKYVAYFSAKSTNRNAMKILLKDIDPEEESGAKREFSDVNEAVGKTAEFLEFLAENPSVKKELTEDEQKQVTRILSELLERLSKREWASFSGWKEICFLNSAIKSFRREVERKTGSPAKPTTTGFRDYAMNRIRIEVNAAEIVKSVDTNIPMLKEPVGSLGSNKGELEFRTEFKFQTGNVTDGSLSRLGVAKKLTQKKFINCIQKILKSAYADDLFQHISELNEIEDVEDIKTVYEQLLYKRYFALDGTQYSPSSGEASMVMLQKELETDKDVYILDEPERSLGHEYINDVILSLIKERARVGKKVFISTHDANIAVRTLPYSSIYRCHGQGGYSTYIGNPFSNNLVNPDVEGDQLDWKKVSMRTLEGGEKAFGERGKIYGND